MCSTIFDWQCMLCNEHVTLLDKDTDPVEHRTQFVLNHAAIVHLMCHKTQQKKPTDSQDDVSIGSLSGIGQ